MTFAAHVDDLYGLNLGTVDIATAIPNSANGVYWVVELARQYLNVVTLTRKVTWSSSPAIPASMTSTDVSRHRAPDDNYRM